MTGTAEVRLAKAIRALGLEECSTSPVGNSHNSTVRVLHRRDKVAQVLKVLRNTEKLDRELRALTMLSVTAIAPQTIESHRDGEWGALLMSQLPGSPMPAADWEAAHARGAGKALALVHASGGISSISGDAWWETFLGDVDTHLERCAGRLPDPLLADTEAALRRAPTLSGAIDPVEIVHYDFRPGNILFSAASATGVVDFESSREGDARLDFAKVSDELTPARYEEFLDGYRSRRRLGSGHEASVRVYLAYQALSCCAWCARNDEIDGEFFARSKNALSTYTSELLG